MVKKRIIPILLLHEGRMIKTIRFDAYRDVGNPVTTARIYQAQRADELLFLDITASVQERNILFDIVREVSQECFMPLGVGGGLRSVEDIRAILSAGADKVVINTAALEQDGFIEAAARRFGSSTIVVSIDVKQHPNGAYEVYTRRAAHATGKDPVHWAREAVARGAGEILITRADLDGTMQGLDTALIEKTARAVDVPVIASGGVGALDDFKHAFDAGASAVGAGSIFHFTDQNIIKTRKFLWNAGVPVRP